eukprot:gnl/TRDRNA2_/TRDRNA2_132380_c0_seq1.p1 gnl/TRDRNA2_/TRDRNA2_132380_c0~~gnl/TRDRNA2_/TRDRNA2_132380_c0_seq1.p1  ORF type:complete len:528 (-),score=87.14 gnl/TRDRNA2_/TRDRNA2_132380_c0_seq1:87-1670(-)
MNLSTGSDLESQPLQRGGATSATGVRMYTWSADGDKKSGDAETDIHHEAKKRRDCAGTFAGKTDTMTYQARSLTSWHALGMLQGTVWSNSGIWIHVLQSLVIVAVVAVLVFFLTEDPAALKAGKFIKVGTFLNIFVGLLLGFFLSSSVSRWHQCATGFLELFDAIRNMQMQCHALGVPSARENFLVRYGVLSVVLLHMELVIASRPYAEHDTVKRRMWTAMDDERPGLVLPQEKSMLRTTNEASGLIWTWVASLVGRMSQDGDIPPMASPTYGRMLNLVQTAHSGIRSVRSSMVVQAPFIYTHLLANLVHMNNILNSIAFGMLLGVTVGTITQAKPEGLVSPPAVEGAPTLPPPKFEGEATDNQAARDIQNLTIGFFFMMVGPIIYQALLQVSILIAQPFNNFDAMVPVLKLLEELERDLREGWKFSECTPSWDKPNYREAMAAGKAKASAPPPAPAPVAGPMSWFSGRGKEQVEETASQPEPPSPRAGYPVAGGYIAQGNPLLSSRDPGDGGRHMAMPPPVRPPQR